MIRFSPRLFFSIVFFFAFFVAINAQKPQFVYKPHSNAGVANNLPSGKSELADFNADGFDDIIISAAGEFRLFLNQGNGKFIEKPLSCHNSIGSNDFAIGDLHSDGDIDIFICRSQIFNVLVNKGDNTFELESPSSVDGDVADEIEIGDLNSDGYPDLVLSGYANNVNPQISRIDVYLTDSLGQFNLVTGNNNLQGVHSGSFNQEAMTLGDIDNDSDLDLFVSGDSRIPGSAANEFAALYLNDGQGVFSASSTSFFPLDDSDALITDIDNDGLSDLIYSGSFYQSPSYVPQGFIYQQTTNGLVLKDTFNGGKYSRIYVEDFDNDGDLDIYQSGQYESAWVVNHGNWNFLKDYSKSFYGERRVNVRVSDLNGDALHDYLVMEEDAASRPFNFVFLRDVSNQVYSTSKHFNPGFIKGFDTADINNDGLTDFAFITNSVGTSTNSAAGPLRIFTNNGAGDFDLNYDSDIHPVQSVIKFFDADGDGDVDLILGAGTPTSYEGLVLYKNDGNGDFSYSGIVESRFSIGSVEVSDLDLDGDLDLIVSTYTSVSPSGNYLWIYHNDGTGLFTKQTSTSLPSFPNNLNFKLMVFDHNSDGYEDLLIPSALPNETKVFLNDSSGDFTEDTNRTNLYHRVYFDQLREGDFNKDGYNDFIAIIDTQDTWGTKSYSRLYLNDQNGGHTLHRTFFHTSSASGTTPLLRTYKIADLDGDSWLDVYGNCGLNYRATGFTVYWGDSLLNLTLDSTFVLEDSPILDWNFATDIEGDGDLDLVWAGNIGNSDYPKGHVFENINCNGYRQEYHEVACGEYFWSLTGCTYTQSGTYSVQLESPSGCYYEHALNLTVNPSPSIQLVQDSILTCNRSANGFLWFVCDTLGNKTLIPNAISQSFAPQQSGFYAVSTIDSACSDTSDCFLYQALSSSELLLPHLKLFPNPSTGFVRLSGLEGNYKLNVFSANGQMVYQGESTEGEFALDLNTNKPGLYLLIIIDDQGRNTQRRLILQ